MVSKVVKVTNEQGMHMRPATVFSAAVTPFDSDVKIKFNGNEFDGKSVMMLRLLSLLRVDSEINLEGAY